MDKYRIKGSDGKMYWTYLPADVDKTIEKLVDLLEQCHRELVAANVFFLPERVEKAISEHKKGE